MNSSNKLPFKKRNSAFDTTPSKNDVVETKQVSTVEKVETKSPFSSTKSHSILSEDVKVEEKEIVQVAKVEEPEVVVVKKETNEPIKEEKKPVTAPQTAKTQTKKVAVKEEDDPNREKYTATMEKTLRKRVKIAAIEIGLQVSSFIEEACKEKLEREGR